MDIIRRHSDYAVRALLHLAGDSRDSIPCRELAQSSGIPESFAYKVLGKLANAGLVASSAGRPGGFRLYRDPESISLLEIVEALQGPIAVSECVLQSSVCNRSDKCLVLPRWRELHDDIIGHLEGTTLQSLQEASGSVN